MEKETKHRQNFFSSPHLLIFYCLTVMGEIGKARAFQMDNGAGIVCSRFSIQSD